MNKHIVKIPNGHNSFTEFNTENFPHWSKQKFKETYEGKVMWDIDNAWELINAKWRENGTVPVPLESKTSGKNYNERKLNKKDAGIAGDSTGVSPD